MKNKIPLILILLALLPLNLKLSFGQVDEYILAQEALKSQDKQFAFMNFRYIAENYPNSRLREKALFATGEYYFLTSDYKDAFKAFEDFLNDYPDSKMKPFALFYIFSIANNTGKEDFAKEMEQQVINWERVILIFKESKEYKLKSPLGINYRLAHYIDRLEFYIDGKLQARISY